jgi:hypothetical protein
LPWAERRADGVRSAMRTILSPRGGGGAGLLIARVIHKSQQETARGRGAIALEIVAGDGQQRSGQPRTSPIFRRIPQTLRRLPRRYAGEADPLRE